MLVDIRRRVFASSDDSSLFIWWLAHAARVVGHWFSGRLTGTGANPLHTALMNFPDGVNGAWNTSILGLALPMAPVTMLAGPIAAYNILIVACPAVSALAGALSARRFMSGTAAGFAGVLYGFGTYVIAQSGGHVNLAFAVLPPIAVGVLYDVLYTNVSRRRIAVRAGLAVALELYISTEFAASTALATLVLLVVLALVDPAVRTRERLVRRLVPTAGLGGAIAAVVGLPLFVALAGPGAPRGAIRPGGLWDTDLLGLVQPAASTLLQLPGPGYSDPGYIDLAERGAYVGVPLLVAVLAVVVVEWRGRRAVAVRTAAATGALVWMLSLGSVLYVAGQPTGIVLPWRIVELVPVFRNILPMRLAVFTALAVAVLAAIGFDRLLHAGRTAPIRGPRRGPTAASRGPRRGVRTASAFAAAALAAVTILPAPVDARAVDVPEFFADGAPGIPAGSVVKTVPRAQAIAEPHADEAMAWQAVAGLRYKSTGGYFIGSTPRYRVIYQAPSDRYDTALDDANDAGGLPSPRLPRSRAAGRALLARHIDFVVVAPSPWLRLPAADVARWTARITDSPAPVRRGGVWVVSLAGR